MATGDKPIPDMTWDSARGAERRDLQIGWATVRAADMLFNGVYTRDSIEKQAHILCVIEPRAPKPVVDNAPEN